MLCFSPFAIGAITFSLHEFVVYSDHEALKYWNSQSSINPKHARWIEYISEYSFVLKHKSGVENKVADALSHIGCLLQTMQLRFSVLTSSKALTPLVLTFHSFTRTFRREIATITLTLSFMTVSYLRGPSYAFLRRHSGTS